MKYKTETHLHTEESSYCSEIPAKDMVELYKKEGFSTVFVTPHYSRHYLTMVSGDINERIDYLLTGYKKAKEYGDKLGLNILLGLELTMVDTKNEYLIYGITEDFLRNNENLYDLTLDELIKLCEVNEFLIVQAHPFRKGITIDPKHLIPIEIFNGRHVLDARNDEAMKYAEEHNRIGISGTDFHDLLDYRGGIESDYEIKTSEDFIKCVLNKEFTPIIPK